MHNNHRWGACLQFKKLVDIHKKSHDIQDREAQIMAGALDFANREVSEIMTPISNVYMLEVTHSLFVKLRWLPPFELALIHLRQVSN